MNITVLNGGSGAKNIIRALQKNKNYKITSIINTFDDGKSTGLIRNIFSMPGPSDIRKVYSLFLNDQIIDYKILKELFDYRFNNTKQIKKLLKFVNNVNKDLLHFKIKDKKIISFLRINLNIFFKFLYKYDNKYLVKHNLNDFSLMNCVYAGSFIRNKRSIKKTIKDFEKIFKLRGSVLCITNKSLYLSATTQDNKILKSEDSIIANTLKKRIKKIYLTTTPFTSLVKRTKINSINKLEINNYRFQVSKEVKNCINKTKILIFAPGTFYSSLIPTYIAKGFSNIIKKNKKLKKIMFTNILNEFDTINYNAHDFINKTLDYLRILNINERRIFFNYIIINKPNKNKKYLNFVYYNEKENKKFKNIIIKNFQDKKFAHDIDKILNFIKNL